MILSRLQRLLGHCSFAESSCLHQWLTYLTYSAPDFFSLL